MSKKIEWRVGDSVRLLGEGWSRIYKIPRGTIVTVDQVREGVPWSRRFGPLLDLTGGQWASYPIEKVEDAEDSNEQAAADARVLADIRALYRAGSRVPSTRSTLVGMDELRVLLRIADEYQELRRSLVDGGDLQNEINEKISNP